MFPLMSDLFPEILAVCLIELDDPMNVRWILRNQGTLDEIWQLVHEAVLGCKSLDILNQLMLWNSNEGVLDPMSGQDLMNVRTGSVDGRKDSLSSPVVGQCGESIFLMAFVHESRKGRVNVRSALMISHVVLTLSLLFTRESGDLLNCRLYLIEVHMRWPT
jgi:hypothetical protein